MNLRKIATTSAAAALTFALLTSSASAEAPHVSPVTKFLQASVLPWLQDDILISAVVDQNARHTNLSQAEIDKLDKQWRAQATETSQPLIDGLLKNRLSGLLKDHKAAAEGFITEVFVMDNKGLNVGLSDVTSDYWQGDEAKWQKTFKAGSADIFVDEIEKDDSTQTLQTQASVVIRHPETGSIIGAITVGINVDLL